MVKTAIFCDNSDILPHVYGRGRKERLAEVSDLYPEVVNSRNFEALAPGLADVEAIFSTWGMTPLSEEQIARMPKLRRVFYAAGSVRYFADPFVARGVGVVNAIHPNAVSVAEFSLAHILLSLKGFYRNRRDYRDAAVRARHGMHLGPGAYGELVGLLGAGTVGRLVIANIQAVRAQVGVLVYDPYLSEEGAAALGVEKAGLDDIFRRAYVVSNHMPNIPATEGNITGAHIRSMRENATFVNTGRGATVREGEMVEALRERPDLTAILDVTWPEPPEEGSPLFAMENVYLTSHIAGAFNDERFRLADFCIEQFLLWQAGKPEPHLIDPAKLPTMA